MLQFSGSSFRLRHNLTLQEEDCRPPYKDLHPKRERSILTQAHLEDR